MRLTGAASVAAVDSKASASVVASSSTQRVVPDSRGVSVGVISLVELRDHALFYQRPPNQPTSALATCPASEVCKTSSYFKLPALPPPAAGRSLSGDGEFAATTRSGKGNRDYYVCRPIYQLRSLYRLPVISWYDALTWESIFGRVKAYRTATSCDPSGSMARRGTARHGGVWASRAGKPRTHKQA